MPSAYANLLRDAYRYAYVHSDDASTKNAAFLIGPTDNVLCRAANDFYDGYTHSAERASREMKLLFIEHAERAVVQDAASRGIATAGLTMICPFAACSSCARQIVRAKINRVVFHAAALERAPARWLTEIAVGFEIFREAGTKLVSVADVLGDCIGVMDGKEWRP